MDTLPNEILEKILAYITNPRHRKLVSEVSKKWKYTIERLHPLRTLEKKLYQGKLCLQTRDIKEDEVPVSRYGGATCYHDLSRSVYLFGGTSFPIEKNDLWKYDIDTDIWRRVGRKGDVPRPKFYSSLVSYGPYLLLYGGYSLHCCVTPSSSINNDLHLYDTYNDTWIHKAPTAGHPPKLYSTAACFYSTRYENDTLALYGESLNFSLGRNKRTEEQFWCLDMESFTWSLQRIVGELREPRLQLWEISIHYISNDYEGRPNLFIFDNRLRGWVLKQLRVGVWSRQLIEMSLPQNNPCTKILSESSAMYCLVVRNSICILGLQRYRNEGLQNHGGQNTRKLGNVSIGSFPIVQVTDWPPAVLDHCTTSRDLFIRNVHVITNTQVSFENCTAMVGRNELLIINWDMHLSMLNTTTR